MKLKQCIKIAEDCGLATIGDAMMNIDMHAMSIFNYEELKEELREMYKEYNDLHSKGLVDINTLLEDVKVLIKE